jgi:methylmalonyl-CoA carboxyltransferase large subunit
MTEHPNNDTLALLAALREEVVALKLRLNGLESVRAELNALKRQVGALEQSAAQAAAAPAPVTEEDILAISAAVAAFLGVRARIRQVRLVHSSAWAQVGRMGTHASHHTH